jgi:hypothetical protein
VTAPIETTGAQAEAQPEAVLVGVDKGQIEGRSLGQIAWSRFKKDKVAVAGGVIVILLILLAVLSRPIQAMFGLDPNALHQDLIDPNTSLPKGDFGGMSWSHPLATSVTCLSFLMTRSSTGRSSRSANIARNSGDLPVHLIRYGGARRRAAIGGAPEIGHLSIVVDSPPRLW